MIERRELEEMLKVVNLTPLVKKHFKEKNVILSEQNGLILETVIKIAQLLKLEHVLNKIVDN